MEQRGAHGRGCLDEVLGVVEHQQAGLAAQTVRDPIQQTRAPPTMQADHGGDLVDDTAATRHGAEIDPMDCIERASDRCRHLDGQPSLARPASARERHDAFAANRSGEVREEFLPTDQRAGGHGHRRRDRVDRPGLGVGQARTSTAEHPDRSIEAVQTVHASVDQFEVGHWPRQQVDRRSRDQQLSRPRRPEHGKRPTDPRVIGSHGRGRVDLAGIDDGTHPRDRVVAKRGKRRRERVRDARQQRHSRLGLVALRTGGHEDRPECTWRRHLNIVAQTAHVSWWINSW